MNNINSLAAQNTNLSFKDFFTKATENPQKIVVVALAIIASLVSIFLLYRYLTTKVTPSLPQSPSQKPPHQQTDLTTEKPDPLMTKPAKDLFPTNNPGGSKTPTDPTFFPGTNTNPMSDEDFAKALQQQEYDQASVKPKPFTPLPGGNLNSKPTKANLGKVFPHPKDTTGLDLTKIKKTDTFVPQKPSGKPSPFDSVNKALGDIGVEILPNPTFSAETHLLKCDSGGVAKKLALNILNEIIEEYVKRYDIPSQDLIKENSKVDEYFANVTTGQTTEQTKYRSLVGIRNLLLWGPMIIDEFNSKQFIGGVHNYGWNLGLNRFKYFTGTVVDLDIELDSEKATTPEKAKELAREKIIEFGMKMGLKGKNGKDLTADDVERAFPDRCLDIRDSIPEAWDNNDRSKYGIWSRVLGGKKLYFVNVPDLDAVLAATIGLPYAIAELAYKTKDQNGGKLPKEFFDAFFKDGLSAKCFNDKLSTFRDFNLIWSSLLEGNKNPKEEAQEKIKNGKFEPHIKKDANVETVIVSFDSLLGFKKDLLSQEAASKLQNKLDILKMILSDQQNQGLKNVVNQLNQEIADHEDLINGYLFDYDSRLNEFYCDANQTQQENAERWIKKVQTEVIEKLKRLDLWKTRLYQTDSESDYFLFDEISLKAFLVKYHKYIADSNDLPYKK